MDVPDCQLEITAFAKTGGPLTKRISLSPDGKLISDGSACIMARGTARRVRLDGHKPFAALLTELGPHEAIALGALRPDLPDAVKITTKRRLDELNGATTPDVITRTAAHLQFRPGEPALALIDVDQKGMQPEVEAAVRKAGGVQAAIGSVLPALLKTGGVWRRSTSSGLMRRDTGEALPGTGGMHWFVLVADGADVGRFLDVLHDRCWLAGYGWMMVGGAGQLLERSLIDRTVGAPERLVFEGAPDVVPPLVQDQAARSPTILSGTALDTQEHCPELTTEERAKVANLKKTAAHRLAPQIAIEREAFINRQIEVIYKRHGIPKKAARRIAERQLGGVLLPGLPLAFDDTDLWDMTVSDVLADPDRFVGCTLADPLEGPEYGRCKAMILRRPDGGLMINSFAHGRARYELRHDTALEAELRKPIHEQEAEAEPAATAESEPPAPATAEEVASAVAHLAGLSGPAYEAERQNAKRTLGISVASLDKLIRTERAKLQAAKSAAARAKSAPPAGKTDWPSGFSMRTDGLYRATEGDAPDIWICPPFEVLGMSRDATGDDHGLWLRWLDIDGREHRWAMPAKMLMYAQSDLEAEMVDRGLRVAATTAARASLRECLGGVRSGTRVTTVSRPGWHTSISGNFAYIRPDGSVIGDAGAEPVVLKSAGESTALVVASAGTLDEWKTEIAAKVAGNDLPVVVLCSAFAAPLLDVAGEGSGGIHLTGESKTGKTLAVRLAASVVGSSVKGGVLRDWKNTANAMEGLAEDANDSLACLDEISQAEPREVVGAVYMLANESGKGRLNRDTTSRKRKTWRLFLLSTGEMDLAAIAAKAGQSLPAGAGVRLPSLEATRETMWTNLHEFVTNRDLMADLQAALRRQYGTAGPAYLERLVEARNADPDALDTALTNMRKRFAACLPTDADPQAHDVARRFAILAAAGEMAINWNILPWKKGEAVRACHATLKRLIEHRGGTAPAEDNQRIAVIRRFLLENGASRFVTLQRPPPSGAQQSAQQRGWEERYPERIIINRAGWRRPAETDGKTASFDDRLEYLIPPDVWKDICAKGSVDPVETARTLYKFKYLSSGDGKNLTHSERVPHVGKCRLYIVTPDLLGECPDPPKKQGDAQ